MPYQARMTCVLSGVVTTTRLSNAPAAGLVVNVARPFASVMVWIGPLHTVAFGIAAPAPSVTETVTVAVPDSATSVLSTEADANATDVGMYRYPLTNSSGIFVKTTKRNWFR